MKSTGIVRCIDSLGRIFLPRELRRTMGISAEDSLEIFVEGDNIVLRKYQPGCALCGEIGDLLDIDGVLICRGCAEKIRRAAG